MGFFGKHWKIDGVTAAFIRRTAQNGQYQALFERENASLEQIEAINWERPVIEKLTKRDNEVGLPEGYGFDLIKVTYDSSTRSYTVTVQTARQYLGDVTEYQAQVKTLQQEAAQKDAAILEKEQTIQQQAAAISAMEQAGTVEQVAVRLEAAYTEGVESNG